MAVSLDVEANGKAPNWLNNAESAAPPPQAVLEASVEPELLYKVKLGLERGDVTP